MTTSKPETQERPQDTAAAPELSINDVAAVRNIIEVVTARGAFKANELTAVGAIYDKISAFLNAAQQPQQHAEKE